MPTAGRLVGAFMIAMTGAVLAFLTSQTFTSSAPDYWWPVCILIGVIIGWRFLGGRKSLEISHGISHGIGAVVLLVFWAFFVLSLTDMLRVAMRGWYKTPLEAIVAIFQLFVGNISTHMTLTSSIILLCLALVAGVITTIAKRMTQI